MRDQVHADRSGFTLSMALVDTVPVLLFGAGMLTAAAKLGRNLFLVGAALTFLGGVCKVLWKLLLALKRKNVRALNKPALPLMLAGIVFVFAALFVNASKLDRQFLLQFPCGLFFGLWLVLLLVMGLYRKMRFDNSAKANWTAQLVNCAAELFFLLSAVCMK